MAKSMRRARERALLCALHVVALHRLRDSHRFGMASRVSIYPIAR